MSSSHEEINVEEDRFKDNRKEEVIVELGSNLGASRAEPSRGSRAPGSGHVQHVLSAEAVVLGEE